MHGKGFGVLREMTAKIFKFPARGKRPPGLVERPAKVLLVVGQDDMREMLVERLVQSGIEVTPFTLDPRVYPRDLLEIYSKARFDVVIPTNVGIPFVYVPDLVSLAQKHGRGASIIVISGWVQDDFVAGLARIPRTAFFPVPVEIEELAEEIRELAYKRRASLPKLRVLVGDAKDNVVGEFLLEWLVARYGDIRNVKGRAVSSGEEILRIAAKVSVDLFVLNFTPLWSPGAPFRDHIDFARHLKTTYGRPICMITGFTEPELKELALAAGVDAYFAHTYQLEEIEAEVNKLLNIREKV